MTWRRLEGSGVAADLNAGLAARIADPLWLLARQWQVGEFVGEDAASPVAISAGTRFQHIAELKLGGLPAEPIDPNRECLEARVEAEPVRSGPAQIRLAAEAGLQILRMARAAGAGSELRERLQAAYPLTLPPDDGLDPRGRLELELLAHASFDGAALAQALASGAAPDPELTSVSSPWLATYQAAFVEPTQDRAPAWDRERMEYHFAVAAPRFSSGPELVASEYVGGRLDWEAFDLAPNAPPALGTKAARRSIDTVPIPLRFPGMPASRWWTFEDSEVYWGDIQGGPEDLARYVIAAFATVYGDDWFIVPLNLPRATLAQTSTIRIVDSFGRAQEIASVAANDFKRLGPTRTWRWFELTDDGAPAKGLAPRLYLPAALPVHEEGQPLEEVLLMRDEASNLAWAVERVIESSAGRRVYRGKETSTARPPQPNNEVWSYQLASTVPPQFVPLVPVRLKGSDKPPIRLQRGRMATADGTIGAKGLILEPQRRLLIHEEEVPASGVRITRALQMCRGTDGSVKLWMGRRKEPGRQPGRIALVHDIIGIASSGNEEPLA
jgi:hypothetical protein